MIAEIISGACLIVGAFFLFLAALGLVRMPDVFCRGHALGLASTLGIVLMLVGLWCVVPSPMNGVKIILAILLQFASIPIASHLVGLLGLTKNVRRYDGRRAKDSVQPMR